MGSNPSLGFPIFLLTFAFCRLACSLIDRQSYLSRRLPMICRKCSKEFPTHVFIDGILHNLCNRKFCLECSPFGKHNTRISLKAAGPVGFQTCCQCHQSKQISQFYKKGLHTSRLQSICIPCLLKYQMRRWNNRKIMMIAKFGNVCLDCKKEMVHPALFDFHHLAGETKLENWTTLRQKAWVTVEKELAKCVLLCAYCHRMRHINPDNWPQEFNKENATCPIANCSDP